MNSEAQCSVDDRMVSEGVLEEIDAQGLADFLAGDGLRVLFFRGGKSVRREAHDTAVALREFLRDYAGRLRAARFTAEAEAPMLPEFRVSATPCLVFLATGEVLEVLPRVRDWADYAATFQRYLGPPGRAQLEGAA